MTEQPFNQRNGIQWTWYYFKTREGAEAFKNKTQYVTQAVTEQIDPVGRLICFEVGEHYYKKRGGE